METQAGKELLEQFWGTLLTPAIGAIARLKIADHLSDGPKTIEELSRLTGSNAGALYRVMRAVSGHGIFKETESKTFELTPKADLLRTDHPHSYHGVALWFSEPWHWGLMSALPESIATGSSAVKHKYNQDLFEYLSQNENAAEIFDSAMTAFSLSSNADVVGAFDFSKFNTIVDVGGGHGSLLSAILKTTQDTKGVLFDLPHVVEVAKRHLQENPLKDRIEFVSGEFFESVPSGGDLYLLKSIIHDWEDTRAIQILSNCREAMSPTGRIMLVERVVPTGNEPFLGKLTDLEMLLLTPGGRERTKAEYENLFSQSGLTLEDIVRPPSSRSLILAKPTP